jgi:O-antigen ligase
MHRSLTAARPAAGQSLAVAAAGVALGVCAVGAATAPAPMRGLWAAAALVPIVCVIVGDVRRLLLVVVALDVPLAIDVNLDYRDDAAALGALGGLGVSLTTFAVLVLWAVALAEPRPAGDPPGVVRRVTLPATVLVGIALASSAVAQDRGLSLFEIALLVQCLLLFAYVATRVRTRSEVLLLVGAMLAGLAIEGMIVAAAYSGAVLDVAGLAARVDDDGYARVGGTVGDPNTAGAYFALLLVPALAVVLAPVGRGLRRLAAVGLGVGVFGLVVTFSRGGWLGFAVALTLFCAVGWHRRWFSLRAPLVVGLALLAVLLPLGGSVVDRLTESDEGSAASRAPLAVTALRMSEDHPLLGVGSNNYTVAMPAYETRDRAREWAYTVHNKYLLVLAETGVAGLVAFLWFLVAGLRAGRRAAGTADPALAMIAVGFTAGLAGQCVHMGVESFRGRPVMQGLFLTAGLLTALAAMAARAGSRRVEAP